MCCSERLKVMVVMVVMVVVVMVVIRALLMQDEVVCVMACSSLWERSVPQLVAWVVVWVVAWVVVAWRIACRLHFADQLASLVVSSMVSCQLSAVNGFDERLEVGGENVVAMDGKRDDGIEKVGEKSVGKDRL